MLNNKSHFFDFGDYFLDFRTISGKNNYATKKTGAYEGCRKNDKKKVAIKAIFDYIPNNEKPPITLRLRNLRGKVISGHLILNDFRLTKNNEMMLISNLLQNQISLTELLKKNNYTKLSEIYHPKHIIQIISCLAEGL